MEGEKLPQQEFGNQLKRIALEYKGQTYSFAVNPEQYTMTRPQRATVFKTQSDNVIQQFGADLSTITFSGNTGHQKDGSGLTGKDRYASLNNFILLYQNDTENGGTPASDLNFYNYTDDESYTVTIPPAGFSLNRSVDNPLIYTYSITLIVIKGTGDPSESDKINSQIGAGSGSGGYAQGNYSGTTATGVYPDSGVSIPGTTYVVQKSSSALDKASSAVAHQVGAPDAAGNRVLTT